MVQGNFVSGDYFIDCDGISQSALRAIFGVWINVCVAVIAICMQFIFRSRIKTLLASGRRRISLWRVSPAVTTSEVIALRGVLVQALMQRDFAFVFVSTFCIVTALVGAASTLISNRVVTTNPILRDTLVQGRNVTNQHNSIAGALLQISNRVTALNRANAPLDELFDFVPGDDYHWIYEADQWHNTWKGKCSSAKHEAVELVVYPTNSTRYQDEVPLLGNYIPPWATIDPSKQGVEYVGFYRPTNNGSGVWVDIIATRIFGTAADSDTGFEAKNSNISIVNYLGHGIARDPSSIFLETRFRSDVHVVECMFTNAVDGGTFFQAKAADGSYTNAAQNVVRVFTRNVTEKSIAGERVIQPTGWEMLRYWQAFMSVKDSQYPYRDTRILSVLQGVVQIRLSALVFTTGAFLLAILLAVAARIRGPKGNAHVIHLPSSQLDWIVAAAREHARNHPDAAKVEERSHLSPDD